ncbi:solute carrier family 67 member A1 isoform X2 [Mycteria americana]|uniref:solute carrier family 67 member A1 isoform X2 n=1 Tax=Mycteria americana TaxID=33587 RepID=UPI003F5860D7
MSAMNTKASSGGEEEASEMRTETLGESSCSGDVKRGQVILVAYLIATLELTFFFMQMGVMPQESDPTSRQQNQRFQIRVLGKEPRFGFSGVWLPPDNLWCAPACGRSHFRKVYGSVWHPSRLNSLQCIWKCLLPAPVHLHQYPPPLPLQAASSVHARASSIFVPTYVGLVGNLINTMIAMVWIPLQAKPKSDHHMTEHSTSQSGSVFSIREILRLMKFPGVMEVFIVKVFAGLPIGLFLIMFSIISMDFFGLEAVESGYLMSYFGVLQMVVQGLVVGKLTNLCTESTLLRLSVFIFIGVGLGMALMRTVWHYCIVAVPLVFAFSTLGTITDSILTKAVPSSDTGTMLGICASVQPLTRTVGPTIGGVLYKYFGVSSFGYLQLIVNIGLFVYLLKSKIPLREMKSQ